MRRNDIVSANPWRVLRQFTSARIALGRARSKQYLRLLYPYKVFVANALRMTMPRS